MEIEKINSHTEVRHSNVITEARFEMTACELDLFFCLLSQLKKEDKQGQKYWLSVRDIETITGRLWQYQQLKESTYNLVGRVYEYHNANGNLVQVTLFASCEYLKGQGVIEVEISEKMRPHLFELKESFTSFRLLASLNMKSKYAKRIYLLCSRWKDKGAFKISIDELKVMLHLKDPHGKEAEQYKQISQFKDFVLNPAKEEINKHSELKIDYELKKRGRSFHEIIFRIDFQKPVQIPIDFQDNEELQKVRRIFYEVGITRDDYLEMVANDKSLCQKVYKWYYDRQIGKFKDLKNPAGHLLKTLGLVE